MPGHRPLRACSRDVQALREVMTTHAKTGLGIRPRSFDRALCLRPRLPGPTPRPQPLAAFSPRGGEKVPCTGGNILPPLTTALADTRVVHCRSARGRSKPATGPISADRLCECVCAADGSRVVGRPDGGAALEPLSQAEIEGSNNNLVDALFDDAPRRAVRTDRADIVRRLVDAGSRRRWAAASHDAEALGSARIWTACCSATCASSVVRN